MKFLVLDVESVGLYGPPFTVGWTIQEFANGERRELGHGCFGVLTEEARNYAHREGSFIWTSEDKTWVKENVPHPGVTHRTLEEMCHDFWGEWVAIRNSEPDVTMAADCLYPVEANFLRTCMVLEGPSLENSPYPVHEIASVMMAAGMDPLATYDRIEANDELPAHNPLADARQSARLLFEALRKLGRVGSKKVCNHMDRCGCQVR